MDANWPHRNAVENIAMDIVKKCSKYLPGLQIHLTPPVCHGAHVPSAARPIDIVTYPPLPGLE